MMGFIKKDLLMLKNNTKSIIITLILFLFYTITFDMDMSFLLPFMSLMLCISTFSYDDYNNWNAYLTTLPKGRINAVKSKYITTIILIIITSIIALISSIIIASIKTSIKIDNIVPSLGGEIIAIILIMSVLYPITIKFGAEKSRIAMVILAIVIIGIYALLTQILHIEISKNIIDFITSNIIAISIVSSTIMITISYFISKKIFLGKEF